ncbi:hypothetical protein ACQKJC_19115 [Priestia koreensis]|uniref:hypothetical protein n=1 Tax=Priestia koreensis TaxID=284581 RepID=UPI003D03112E
MNKKMFVLSLSLASSLSIISLTGCSNQNDSSPNNDKSTKHKDILQQYSKDPDSKKKNEDFDLIGKLKKETNNNLVLTIDNKEVEVPKSKLFQKDKDVPKDVIGKQVNLEINAKDQAAESLELTPQAKADANGIYEKDADGDYSVIGKLMEDTENEVTIQASATKKNYKKAKDFEYDNDNTSQDMENKIVRIELNKNNEVESLEMNPEDQ